MLEEGVPVDLVFFDFKKAFDTVPHNRLILKLKNLGIDGKLLDVIKDFLSNRSFRVSVEGEMSDIRYVLSGIPQGTVLGPILFLVTKIWEIFKETAAKHRDLNSVFSLLAR